MPGQAGFKEDGSRRSKGSQILPCALHLQRLPSNAKLEASAASATSSAVPKPTARRGLIIFSRVQLLLADGDQAPAQVVVPQ